MASQEVPKIIRISTKEQLKVFMNPVRQQLLHELQVSGAPMTPKSLSVRLAISASSVQHHIRKLLELGVVAVDHTEIINGIHATFYVTTPATIQIGAREHPAERRAVLMQLVNNVLSGFLRVPDRHPADEPDDAGNKYGDIMTGIAYITDEERRELFSLVTEYLRRHEKKEPDTRPWEYALILYDTAEAK